MVRTRMAPSPTGKLHLGTAYATLWPYLFARKNNGVFILRIEDTDIERSRKEFEENILEGLTWLGFKWEEGPFHQMERLDLYKHYTDKLLSEDKAYYCFCTKEELEEERKRQKEQNLPLVYSGKCRKLTPLEVEEKKRQGLSHVIRFKLPENRGVIEFDDLIMGKIGVDSKLLGDMVIMRSNGIPLYNYAVVIDDIDLKITHVIRGSDHISNTPKQILFFEAFNVDLPFFAHYPMVLNPDRIGKLSKRTGSTSVDEYRKDGYLPEAIINYLSLLGITPPEDKEIVSFNELEKIYDISLMNKSAAAWSVQKLDWINGEYIRKMSDEELNQRLQEYLVDHPDKDKIAPVVSLIKERIKKLSDFIPLTHFIFSEPEYDIEVFNRLKIENTKDVIKKIQEKLESMKSPWDKNEFEETFRNLSNELNIPVTNMFQLIRVIVSGQLVTPPLFECIEIIGEEKVLRRFEKALLFLPD